MVELPNRPYPRRPAIGGAERSIYLVPRAEARLSLRTHVVPLCMIAQGASESFPVIQSEAEVGEEPCLAGAVSMGGIQQVTGDTIRYASPRKARAISKTPAPMPRSGCARSALPPSAAIVSVARQIDLAPSGNVKNSFSAALIHEIGLVARVICVPR